MKFLRWLFGARTFSAAWWRDFDRKDGRNLQPEPRAWDWQKWNRIWPSKDAK